MKACFSLNTFISIFLLLYLSSLIIRKQYNNKDIETITIKTTLLSLDVSFKFDFFINQQISRTIYDCTVFLTKQTY